MNREHWRKLLRAAAIRAAHTVLQAAAGYLTGAAALEHFSWRGLVTTALVAGAVSMIKSLAAGLPEVPEVGPDD